MKFLRLAQDKSTNVTLAVVQTDSSVFMYRRVGNQRNLNKHYQSIQSALKAFDKQVGEDYSSSGIYYDSFEEAEG